MSTTALTINEPNVWRLRTPGHASWPRTARPGDPQKYFIVSADAHANEPADLWVTRIDAKYRERVPRVTVDANGVKWRVSEGHRPDRLRTDELEGEDRLRQLAGADPEQRLRDMDRDGIDAEVIFPNKGLSMWATPDGAFAMAQCRVYNEWAWETYATYNHRMSPAAAIATADLEGSIAEVQRVARLGFRALTLPCKPVWGAHDVDHPELQPAGLRSAVGGDPGREPADHLPRLDRARPAGRARQRWRRHQLRVALAVADDRAGGQPLRLRRAVALPAAALRDHRGRHRLGGVAARRHGRGVQEAPLLGPAQARAGCRASTSASTGSPRSRRTRRVWRWPNR